MIYFFGNYFFGIITHSDFFIFSIKPGSLVIFAIFVHKKYRRLSELLELNESGVEEKKNRN